MPQPSLSQLRQKALESERQAEARFEHYLADRGNPTYVAPIEEEEEEEEAEPPRTPPPQHNAHLTPEREQSIYRLVNEGYACMREGKCVSSPNSSESYHTVKHVCNQLKTEIELLEHGSVPYEDVRVVLRPLQTTLALLEYWHGLYPKEDSAIVLPNGKRLKYTDAALTMDSRVVFAEHADACEPGMKIMAFFTPEGTELTIYCENLDGDMTSFDPDTLKELRAYIHDLIAELQVDTGEECAFVV